MNPSPKSSTHPEWGSGPRPLRQGLGCVVVLALLALAPLLLLAAAALYGPRLVGDRLGGGLATAAVAPAAPLAAEVDAAQRAAAARLQSYGWVNQEAGVVHIPIGRAMALIAETGLPVGLEATAAHEPPPEAVAAIDPASVSFRDDVLPIFRQHCTECHGPEDPEDGLQLSGYANTLAGSDNGPVIEPGDPAGSYLIELIVSGRMPKNRDPLSPNEIEIISAWVRGGAADN